MFNKISPREEEMKNDVNEENERIQIEQRDRVCMTENSRVAASNKYDSETIRPTHSTASLKGT